MKIAAVRYGFTFNRPNYQSERIDMEATIDPEESPQIVYHELKSRVHALGGDLRTAQAANQMAERLRAGTSVEPPPGFTAEEWAAVERHAETFPKE